MGLRRGLNPFTGRHVASPKLRSAYRHFCKTGSAVGLPSRYVNARGQPVRTRCRVGRRGKACEGWTSPRLSPITGRRIRARTSARLAADCTKRGYPPAWTAGGPKTHAAVKALERAHRLRKWASELRKWRQSLTHGKW